MVIKFKSNKEEWYKQFIRLISISLDEGLSSMETNVLDQIFKIGDTDQKLITPEVRRNICKNLDISTQNLNNYIAKLKKRKFIVFDRLNPKLNMLTITDEPIFQVKVMITE